MKNHDAGELEFRAAELDALIAEDRIIHATECDCCGGKVPESPAVIGGDVLCDACLVAITTPATVEALLALGKASQHAVDAYTRTVAEAKSGRWA